MTGVITKFSVDTIQRENYKTFLCIVGNTTRLGQLLKQLFTRPIQSRFKRLLKYSRFKNMFTICYAYEMIQE